MKKQNNEQNNAPVKVGEEYEVEIYAIGDKGDGLAKINNFCIFVPQTEKGETVRIRVYKVLPKFAFAEVISSAE